MFKLINSLFWGSKKCLLYIFFCFSFKNKRRTDVVLVNILKINFKKLINCQKWPKWHFWRLIAFFSVFSKIPTKRTFVCTLFLKLNQSRNMKKNFFFFFFLQIPKTHIFRVQIISFKSQISNFFFLRLFFNVKGRFMPIFTKKIYF